MTRFTPAVLLALLIIVAGTAAGRGPPSAHAPEPGHTGGFGEPTCYACHFDGPERPSDAAVRIEGLPVGWIADSTYTLTVVLRATPLARAGFQLAARFASGKRAGSQAGSLLGSDRVAVTAGAGIAYAHHRLESTQPADSGVARWQLRWRAPADGNADVAFHVAANAANDDASELGDRIVTSADTVAPAR